jgi:TatD DNase family protein
VIDTHAHLDMLEDADAALDRARAAGVKTILTVGIDRERWRRSLELADRHDDVRVILGIHPHNAGGDTTVDELREAQGDPRVVAVGETGLDYYRDYAPRQRQRDVFEAQLALAAELDKPVVVHTRAADEDTVAALRRHRGDIVLHCFSAPALLRPALEHGWYVSFAGNVTYPKAAELRWAAARVPAERILAETDTPYLAPQPVRGRRSEPAHVLHTLAALAEERGERRDELERTIEANAAEAFELPSE